MYRMVFAATLFVVVTPVSYSRAQDSDFAFFSQLDDAIGTVSPDTARQSHAICLEIGNKIAARSGMSPLMRLYFESQVERCIALAMNNGSYSDDSGDQCSHQFAHASKLAQLLKEAGSHEVNASLLPEYRDRLESAVRDGEEMKCAQDFASFKG